jgi:hypothetical protein
MPDDPLVKLYEKILKEKHFFAEKAWETIKFHTILSSSLISITIAALVGLHTSETFLGLILWKRLILLSILLILPFTMKKVIVIGFSNFERECKRMYEHSAILMKIEEKLKFRKEREKTGNLTLFPEDKKYLSPRFFKKKWANTDKFIDDMLNCNKKKDNLYCNMKKIFELFIDTSRILIFSIILVIALHLVPWIIKSILSILG